VEAEATPRQTRGAIRKATEAPIEQMERKGGRAVKGRGSLERSKTSGRS